MRKTIIVAVGLLALLTTACQPAAGTAAERGLGNVPGASVIWLASDGAGNDVSKFCDAGRAVYVADGYLGEAGPGLHVVDNAPECAQ